VKCPNDANAGRGRLASLAGRVSLVLSSLAVAVASGCDGTEADADKPPRIVAYVSADDAIAREVLAACSAETGIEIVPVFDTEATKSTGLENRLRAERDRPRADVFWSSEGFATARLASEGVLAPMSESVCAALDARRCDPGRRWVAFAARARVVVWNPAKVSEPPESWWDLPDAARDVGELPIAIADPRFGTTRGHLAALREAWRVHPPATRRSEGNARAEPANSADSAHGAEIASIAEMADATNNTSATSTASKTGREEDTKDAKDGEHGDHVTGVQAADVAEIVHAPNSRNMTNSPNSAHEADAAGRPEVGRAAGTSIDALDAWIDRLVARGVRVLPGGNAATVDAVVAGEALFGLTDSDDALAAIARGLPIAMSLPRTHAAGVAGGGTMIVPNTAGIVLGGPGSDEAAERVVAWLASARCEELLCRSASRNMPLGATVACDPGFAEPDPLAFDALAAQATITEVAERAARRLAARVAP
jgi:ABC-type Fe3+ transport system substrate-binding protein